jgi:hypothetical protein
VQLRRAGYPILLALPVAVAGVLSGCTTRTAPPPNLFMKAAVYCDVTADPYGKSLLEDFIQYARLFGCPPVQSRDQADYTIAGAITVREAEPKTLPDGELRQRWVVSADLRLLDAATGAVAEEFPPVQDLVFYFGRTLGQPDVQECLADLVIETKKPYFYNDVVQKILAMGPRAVPYLICGLRDLRTVELKGSLPRLDPAKADRVRVCDVANYALEQVFGLETRLAVGASRSEVFRHVRAWQLAWTERCAGYLVGEKLTEYLAARRARRSEGRTP